MKEQRALKALNALSAYLNDSRAGPLVSKAQISEAESHAQEALQDFKERLKDEEDNETIGLFRTYVKANTIPSQHFPTKQEIMELRNLCRVERRLNYMLFRKIRDQAPQSVQSALQPDVFLMFQADRDGMIDSAELEAYVRHYFLVQEMRALLITYMRSSASHITEAELRRFMFDILPRLGYREYNRFFARGAAKKFTFELDTNRTRRVRLDILLSSDVFREFLALMKDVEDGIHGPGERNGQKCKNWFCEDTQTTLYEIYFDLDVNMDGLLSDSEMLSYTGFNTNVIIPRVILDMIFEVYLPYKDRVIDYDAFIDIVLAYEYRDSPAGLQYLWRLCDVSFTGGLSATDIRQLYRGITESLAEQMPDPKDVVSEIFDMANVKEYELITREHLRATGMEGIIIPILTDAHTFWRYENRELNLSEEDDQQQLDSV